MAEISLTNGGVSYVDDDDAALVSQYRWWAARKKNGTYAETVLDGHSVGMHRLILGYLPPLVGHHIDGDGLNNRRANLKAVTRAYNQRHQVTRTPKYGYFGIRPERGGWMAYATLDGLTVRVGRYATPEDAAKARADYLAREEMSADDDERDLAPV